MKLFMTIFVFFIFLSYSVFGFGLASSYLENKTLFLMPGEEIIYQIELQNNDPNVHEFKFNLESDVAEIINPKESYFVGGDKRIVPIDLLIKMPKNAMPGDEYDVRYSAFPITQSNSAIGLNIEFSNNFKVVGRVIETPKNEYSGGLHPFSYIGLISIFILFSISILLVFRKNKSISKRIYKKRTISDYEKRIREINDQLKRI